MSSNSTIFLTEDNEHCYRDCNNQVITLELDKRNIRVVTNNDDDLIIEIAHGSELYALIKMMKD